MSDGQNAGVNHGGERWELMDVLTGVTIALLLVLAYSYVAVLEYQSGRTSIAGILVIEPVFIALGYYSGLFGQFKREVIDLVR